MRNPITYFIGMAFCLLMISYAQAYHQPFPDTGQNKCYNNEQEIACPLPGEPFFGQDVQYQPRLPRSYTRLKSGGSPWIEGLDSPEQWHMTKDPKQWVMTKDNVTGLTWEVKTDETGLRNKNNTYTWYNPGHSHPGVQDGGDCSGSDCDTYAYIKTLNDEKFGGLDNWRLPSRQELASISKFPKIDTDWFPNIISYPGYWSSTTWAGSLDLAWNILFSLSIRELRNAKSSSHPLIAVSSGVLVPHPLIDNHDGTVTDPNTDLTWQKCSYGQEWDGCGCSGEAEKMTWQIALEHSENLTLANHSDWRLPNINELQTLVDDSRKSPAIASLLQNNTESSFYWSSTTNVNSFEAMLKNFDIGSKPTSNKSSSYFLRAVRGGISHVLNEQEKADHLFNLLESVFPQVLSPAPQPTVESEGVMFRRYSDTMLTIGIVEDDLYLLDHADELHYLGKVDFWLSYTKAETIFNWLESEYPHILTPSSQPTLVLNRIIYRYYQDTNVYIATLDNELFYIDDNVELYNPGNVDGLLPYAQ